MSSVFDVVVMGAGPGGRAAAAELAAADRKVAMIESFAFGGVCPLEGCNPKKILAGAAEVKAEAAHWRGSGLTGELAIDWPELMAFKRGFTEPVDREVEKHYSELGIRTVRAKARFVDEGAVEADGKRYEADHFVVATGAEPRPLSEPGSEFMVTNREFLDLDELPERIVFVGGGFISFEFAHVAARAGARAVIIHRSERPLRGFDPDMVRVLLAATVEAGIEFHGDTPLRAIEKNGDGFLVRAGQEGELGFEADLVVHGAGRAPTVKGLGLEKAGVPADKKGITVNPFMQSVGNERVYAVGDCAATPFALTPVGDMEGRLAARNILHGNIETANYTAVPSVVFSVPPLCGVGMSERAARESGRDIEIVSHDMADWFPWKRTGEKHAAAKLIVDKRKGTLLGAHAVGRMAGELSNLFAMAIRLELPLEELRKVIWAYPTSLYYFPKMVAKPL